MFKFKLGLGRAGLLHGDAVDVAATQHDFPRVQLHHTTVGEHRLNLYTGNRGLVLKVVARGFSRRTSSIPNDKLGRLTGRVEQKEKSRDKNRSAPTRKGKEKEGTNEVQPQAYRLVGQGIVLGIVETGEVHCTVAYIIPQTKRLVSITT